MEAKSISPYKIWYVIVMIDRLSTASRKRLKAKGFTPSAFSKSLMRTCGSLEVAKLKQAEVQECLRKGDLVQTLLITDRQLLLSTTNYGH
jgi:hypothetical protein